MILIQLDLEACNYIVLTHVEDMLLFFIGSCEDNRQTAKPPI